MATCIQCQQDKEMWQLFVKYKAGPTASEDRYCCHECNALNSRINRLGTQHEELVKEFTKVRADKKATFYEENAKCFGADLVKNMSAVVEETNTHRKHSQSEAKGTLMDEMQVREHFKHMPSRAEATLRNAKKTWDEESEVYLYAVKVYTTKESEENTYVGQWKRKLEAAQNMKKEKVVKTTGTGEEGGGKGGGKGSTKKALPKAVLKKMEKFTADYEVNCQELTSKITQAKAPEIVHLIPQHILSKAEKTLEMFEEAKKRIDDVLKEEEPKLEKDAQETLMSTINAQSANVTTWTEKLDGYILDASEADSGST